MVLAVVIELAAGSIRSSSVGPRSHTEFFETAMLTVAFVVMGIRDWFSSVEASSRLTPEPSPPGFAP
jgi:hypothetical protein